MAQNPQSKSNSLPSVINHKDLSSLTHWFRLNIFIGAHCIGHETFVKLKTGNWFLEFTALENKV